MDETIGLVTAGTEIMTGQAGKVGRGLRSIGANIAKLATDAGELEYTVNGVTKSISLFDETTGDMKNTYQVLSEISEDWDKMSKAEQSTLAIAQAGKTQIDVYTSVMSNFDTAINATNTSINSQGSAMNENSKYMESMGAKLNALKAQFQELVLGDGGLNTFLKGLIDLGTGILKFANSDLGQTIIAMGSTYLALTLLVKGYNALKIATIATTIATKGLAGALATLNINPIILAITAIVGVIYGGLVIAKKVNDELDNNIEKTKEMASEYNDATSSVESLTEKLNSINKKISEINSQNGIEIATEGQTAELIRQKEELETMLRIEKERQSQAKKELEDQAKKSVEGKITDSEQKFALSDYYKLSEEEYTKNEVEIRDGLDRIEVIKLVSSEMLKQQSIIDELSKKKEKNNGISEEEQQILDDSIAKYNSARQIGSEYSTQIQEEIKDLEESSETRKNATIALDSYSSALNETSDTTARATDNVVQYENESDDLENDLSEQETKLESLNKQLEATATNYKNTLSSIDGISSSYDTLTSAMEEYNSTNQLSLDSLDKLLSLDDEYLSLLQFENGQLSINAEGFQALANSKIDEAEATAIQEAQSKLALISQNSYNDSMAESLSASYMSVQASKNAGQAILNSGNDAIVAMQAWQNAWNTISQGYEFSTNKQNQQALEVQKSLKSSIMALEGARSSIGKYTGATIKATSATKGSTNATKSQTDATKGSTNATKSQTDALNDLKSQYEKVISYINKQIDKQIDKIKELKEKELDEINSKIKALEEKKDSEEAYYDAQIDKINKENEAIESQLELETLLDNLAKAKSKKVMVLKEDGNFGYESDDSEVTKAKAELESYKRKKQQEDRITKLEESKDKAIQIYQDEIKALEKYKEEIEKKYDSQIEYYENYKKQFSDIVDSYENEQNRLLALQLTGIDFEKEGWEKRLDNLKSFVDEYNKLLSKIDSSSQVSSFGGTSNGSFYEEKTDKGKISEDNKPYTVFKILETFDDGAKAGKARSQYGNNADGVTQYGGRYVVYKKDGTYPNEKEAQLKTSSLIESSNGKLKYGFKQFSSGVNSIKEDGIAIVGENPNKEIVIGSKLNNGIAMNLSKGSGVVNAKHTNTLVELLNSIPNKLTPSNSNEKGVNITIGNITLPSVTNANEFVSDLKNKFRNYTISAKSARV